MKLETYRRRLATRMSVTEQPGGGAIVPCGSLIRSFRARFTTPLRFRCRRVLLLKKTRLGACALRAELRLPGAIITSDGDTRDGGRRGAGTAIIGERRPNHAAIAKAVVGRRISAAVVRGGVAAPRIGIVSAAIVGRRITTARVGRRVASIVAWTITVAVARPVSVCRRSQRRRSIRQPSHHPVSELRPGSALRRR